MSLERIAIGTRIVCRALPALVCLLAFAAPTNAAQIGFGKVLVDKPEASAALSETTPFRPNHRAPVVGDIDGDGDLEIVTVQFMEGNCGPMAGVHPCAYLMAWHHDGRPVTGWPVAMDGAFYTTPAISTTVLGELDGQPGLEVIVGTVAWLRPFVTGGVVGYRGDGTQVFSAQGTSLFGEVSLGATLHAPVVADVDSDGTSEVIVTGHSRIGVFTNTGTLKPGWPVDLVAEYGEPSDPEVPTLSAPVSVGDLDDDGSVEIVAVTSRRVYAWEPNGVLRAGGWPVNLAADSPPVISAPPMIGSLGPGGTMGIAVTIPPRIINGATQPATVIVYDEAGGVVSQTRQPDASVPGRADAALALGDVDNDGIADLVTAFGSESEVLRSFSSSGVMAARAFGELRQSPVIARLPDGSRRLYSVGSDGRLYGWNIQGQLVDINGAPGPLDLQMGEPLAPMLADLNNDGWLELVVQGYYPLVSKAISSDRGELRVIPLGIQGTVEWGTFKGDAQRTGWLRN